MCVKFGDVLTWTKGHVIVRKNIIADQLQWKFHVSESDLKEDLPPVGYSILDMFAICQNRKLSVFVSSSRFLDIEVRCLPSSMGNLNMYPFSFCIHSRRVLFSLNLLMT